MMNSKIIINDTQELVDNGNLTFVSEIEDQKLPDNLSYNPGQSKLLKLLFDNKKSFTIV